MRTHTAHPHRTLCPQGRKRPSRERIRQTTKPGRKAGHKGVSHHRKSSRTVHYVPDSCSKCGSTDIAAGRIADMKQVTDIPFIPQAETVSHITHDGTCSRCGTTTTTTKATSLYADGVGMAVRGTSIGPILASKIVQMWHHNMSIGGITDMLGDTFGAKLSKAAVQCP